MTAYEVLEVAFWSARASLRGPPAGAPAAAALPLRRRLVVVFGQATEEPGDGDPQAVLAAYVDLALVRKTVLMVALAAVVAWLPGPGLSASQLGALVGVYASSIASVWAASGLAVLLQAAAPRLLQPAA